MICRSEILQLGAYSSLFLNIQSTIKWHCFQFEIWELSDALYVLHYPFQFWYFEGYIPHFWQMVTHMTLLSCEVKGASYKVIALDFSRSLFKTVLLGSLELLLLFSKTTPLLYSSPSHSTFYSSEMNTTNIIQTKTKVSFRIITLNKSHKS